MNTGTVCTIQPVDSEKDLSSTQVFRRSDSLERGKASEDSTAHSQETKEPRKGYPRFAAFTASCPEFRAFRRFNATRMRLLLLKQDEISVLEEELEMIDNAEPRQLFLGSCRRDVNEKRKDCVARLRKALAEYDQDVFNAQKMSALPSAKPRDIQSIRAWAGSTSSIALEETAFLDHAADLMCPRGDQDEAVERLEPILEDTIIFFHRGLQKLRGQKDKLNWYTYDYTRFHLNTFTRGIIAWIVIALLLVPIVVMNKLAQIGSRIGVVLVADALFVLGISLLSRARSVHIFAIGAAYAAVLVVFLDGKSGSGPAV